MTKKDEKTPLVLNFNFKDVKTKEYFYTEPKKKIKIGDDVKFDASLTFLPNIKTNEIVLDIFIKIRYIEEKICTINTAFHFSVNEIDSLPVKENSIKIPDELMKTLISLSISTLRGILIERGKGTIVEKLIIPPLDPNQLLPNKNTE